MKNSPRWRPDTAGAALRRPLRSGRGGGRQIVAFPVPFHFGDFIAFFIAQMNFQLVKGNVDVILPAQAVDGAVELIYRVAAIAQFSNIQTQFMIQVLAPKVVKKTAGAGSCITFG